MKSFLVIVFFFLTLGSFSQVEYVNTKVLEYRNMNYEKQINSVLLYRKGDILSLPNIPLGGNGQLALLFDDFNTEIQDYMVSFIHCTPDWKPTGLDYMQVVDGIDHQYITDYDFSGPTKQRYLQYRFEFPNESAQFRLSGNYLLLVYRNEDKSDLILTRRFMVTESRIRASVDIHQATINKDYRRRQEVDLILRPGAFRMENIYENLEVQILQNGRWDNMVSGLKPLFIKPDELDYDYDEENTFEGGNEYRLFDTRPTSFNGLNVGKVGQQSDTNIVFLTLGERRNIRAYRDYDDLNGRVLYDVQDERYSSPTDMDYHLVYFSLPQPYEFPGGKVYLMGEFTGNEIKEEFQMKYNEEQKIYFGKAYLKQGYYNYIYLFVPDGESAGQARQLEGTHAATENMYSILVYYKSIHEDHHRLIFFENYRINF
ncbi:DUF5103 domain-containing protein [Salibacteraceae bacterium]|jgi:hypothetical protein|nr:DUF5103 domain-containing protein [Salibacteraceae bacterium]